ncbi:exported hypothetical protein [uncultured Eubacteriales bacterium]|uniref:Copper amine oxidase-like N-terminal domain-containing protein n=1 Tax=uncultured Eubacteriales bacterium TaxID=172733 RepID=A0A212J491_9FIRM|nr:exported hypothetical protein [uncultured Eubacteriales bacterium]
MKKERLKDFVSGIIVTALVLALASGTLAVYQKTATLDYAGINITLDGKSVIPTDANGNAVEPFAIDGTTYLPVRGIASALGLDVTWDDTTSTVVLNDIPQEDITDSEYKVAIQDMYIYCKLINVAKNMQRYAEFLKIYAGLADSETASDQLEKIIERCLDENRAGVSAVGDLLVKRIIKNEDRYMFNYLTDAQDQLVELHIAAYGYRRTKDSETYDKISPAYSAVIKESTKVITAAEELLESVFDNSQKKR